MATYLAKILLGETTAQIIDKLNKAITQINVNTDGLETAGKIDAIYINNNAETSVVDRVIRFKSGTNVTLSDDGLGNVIFSSTDTKNTAGANVTTEKLYLIGAKTNSGTPETHTGGVYIKNGELYHSDDKKVLDNDDKAALDKAIGDLAGGMEYIGTSSQYIVDVSVTGTYDDPYVLDSDVTYMSGDTIKVDKKGYYIYKDAYLDYNTDDESVSKLDIGDLFIYTSEGAFSVVPSGDDGDVYADDTFTQGDYIVVTDLSSSTNGKKVKQSAYKINDVTDPIGYPFVRTGSVPTEETTYAMINKYSRAFKLPINETYFTFAPLTDDSGNLTGNTQATSLQRFPYYTPSVVYNNDNKNVIIDVTNDEYGMIFLEVATEKVSDLQYILMSNNTANFAPDTVNNDVYFEYAYSVGLEYALSSAGTNYLVKGIGTCTDTDLVIYSYYKGLPVTEIYTQAFYDNTDITSINIIDGLTVIGAGAFKGCTSLKTVTLPNSITEIASSAFERCSALNSIVLSDNITIIDSSAFALAGLRYGIVLSNGLLTIGYRAFSESNLTYINIPANVTDIFAQAFYKCSYLSNINVDENNQNWSSVDGVLYDKIGSTLHTYPCDKLGNPFTVPDTVTCIGAGAFAYAGRLSSINLPNNLYEIGVGAFEGCTKLSMVTLPDSLTDIGMSAFMDCTSLSVINIPSKIKNIPTGTFLGCVNLYNIVFDAAVTMVYANAFYDCDALENVHYNGTKSQWNSLLSSMEEGNDALKNASFIYCTDGTITN